MNYQTACRMKSLKGVLVSIHSHCFAINFVSATALTQYVMQQLRCNLQAIAPCAINVIHCICNTPDMMWCTTTQAPTTRDNFVGNSCDYFVGQQT